MSKPKSVERKITLFLIAIISIGAFLRFYNLNWDHGLTFHPDERNIDAAVSRVEFFQKMDPEFFAYGGLPVYLYNGTTEVLSELTKDQNWKYNWGKINLVGRTYSAIFSTLTIALIFLLSRKLFNRRVGLIAAVFSAFAPSFIQTAHFGITESFITFMSIIITILSLNLYKKFDTKRIFFLGFALGLSVAAKTSAVSFTIIPLSVFIVKLLKEKKKLKSLGKFIPLGLAFLLITISVFTIFSPYTFLSWDKFIESMEYEGGVVSGSRPVPYTHQFIGTTPYLYQLININWQVGLVAVASYLGVILLVKELINKRSPRLFIFLSFPLVYFAYVGSWHTKFIRYMVPLLPFLLISSAHLFDKLISKRKNVGYVLTSLFIILTIVWGVSFFSIYTREQTRVSSSEWMYENMPTGSLILTEHWDDGLPIDIREKDLLRHQNFDIKQLTIYEPDDFEKIQYYANELSEGDYVVLNSRRLYGTLINLYNKYPITSRYYQLLFSEGLGYTKVAEFSSYPSFLGLEINDDKSEETFQVYDHNKVIIFENTMRLDRDDIASMLGGL